MRPIVYGMILLTSLTLMGCSLMPEPKVVTVTKTVKTEVPIVARPKQVQLNDIKIYVVSSVNSDPRVRTGVPAGASHARNLDGPELEFE